MAQAIDRHATQGLEGQRLGAVAQLGERCNRTAEVRGSNPLSSTRPIAQAIDLPEYCRCGSGRSSLVPLVRLPVCGGPRPAASRVMRACPSRSASGDRMGAPRARSALAGVASALGHEGTNALGSGCAILCAARLPRPHGARRAGPPAPGPVGQPIDVCEAVIPVAMVSRSRRVGHRVRSQTGPETADVPCRQRRPLGGSGGASLISVIVTRRFGER
jgi:hypothetical protein